jgi:hypothetical protein
MIKTKAMILIRQCRNSIGGILRKFQEVKHSPEDWPLSKRQELSKIMKSNKDQLTRLYKQYPDLRPIRTRQMRLKLN